MVEEFQPVQLPELLVITGRACTRILSGYQKTKKEEETILASLREEGLLAKPGGKGVAGISFEIVDIATAGEDLSVGVVAPQGVIPDKKLRYFIKPAVSSAKHELLKFISYLFKGSSPKKKTGKCGNFEKTGGGGLPESHFHFLLFFTWETPQ